MAKLKMNLRKQIAKQSKKPAGPVWRGPEVDGITQSLLGRFLVCRERFRLLVVEGLKPPPAFIHRIEYGQMWHTCEEAFAKNKPWVDELKEYCRLLCLRYPLQQEQIVHWYEVCKVQFPVYTDYWKRHPDVKNRRPLLQEVSFKVPYELPSGRTVLLRGKWDSVDLIGKGKSASVYLQENKTKGDIDELQMKQQLQFDLQTGIYLTSLDRTLRGEGAYRVGDRTAQWDASLLELGQNHGLAGVRYNVIRRPLSGGKGSIRRHKATKNKPEETAEHFYGRLRDEYIAAEPEYYFMRWKVEFTPDDLRRFQQRFLNPVLEQLCDWWEWVSSEAGRKDPWKYSNMRYGEQFKETGEVIAYPGIHWQHPHGVYNVLNEGGSSDLDECLRTGSKIGLQRTDNLFPEIT